jgi:sec-independent protein translocase protein TatA
VWTNAANTKPGQKRISDPNRPLARKGLHNPNDWSTHMLGLDNPVHLLILLAVLLLIFGAKRLPEMGRSLGTGLRGFKESLTGEPSTAASAELSCPDESTQPTSAEHSPVA